MKFSTGLIFSTLALAVFGKSKCPSKVCDNTIRSCSSTTVDTCCSPKLGLLVLALQWSPGFGPDNTFTLHGLWPDYCDGSYGPDKGCDADRQYNATTLATVIAKDPKLLDEMNNYWPSYKKDNPVFWMHEWGKHGTCHSTVDPKCYKDFQPGQDAIDYFKLSLALRAKHDVYPVLKQSNIIPGRTYTKAQFQEALNKIGAESQLICRGNKLDEIRLFFYVNGKENFVVTNAIGNSTCPNNIDYPVKFNSTL